MTTLKTNQKYHLWLVTTNSENAMNQSARSKPSVQPVPNGGKSAWALCPDWLKKAYSCLLDRALGTSFFGVNYRAVSLVDEFTVNCLTRPSFYLPFTLTFTFRFIEWFVVPIVCQLCSTNYMFEWAWIVFYHYCGKFVSALFLIFMRFVAGFG